MRAYKRFGKFDAEQSFWNWIAAIANHHCIDLLRQRNRSQELFGDESTEIAEVEAVAAAGTPVVQTLIAAQDAQALNAAIAQLPDKYRVPLVLAYVEQCSYEAVATQLSISQSHVGVLLLRAKQRLRDLLEGAVGGTEL